VAWVKTKLLRWFAPRGEKEQSCCLLDAAHMPHVLVYSGTRRPEPHLLRSTAADATCAGGFPLTGMDSSISTTTGRIHFINYVRLVGPRPSMSVTQRLRLPPFSIFYSFPVNLHIVFFSRNKSVEDLPNRI
jgi:hypothetical protein